VCRNCERRVETIERIVSTKTARGGNARAFQVKRRIELPEPPNKEKDD
jgi:hypothetical protein